MNLQADISWIQAELSKVRDPELITAFKSLLKYRKKQVGANYEKLTKSQFVADIKEAECFLLSFTAVNLSLILLSVIEKFFVLSGFFIIISKSSSVFDATDKSAETWLLSCCCQATFPSSVSKT